MSSTTPFKFDPSIEPLLQPNPNRFSLFPIEHPDIWKMAKTAMSTYWVAETIDFSNDLDDWNNKLNDGERFFIENVLTFFMVSDGIVNENLCLNFSNEIQWAEARYLYASQIQIESIHSEVYSLMVDTYISDQNKKQKIFNALDYNPVVKKKAEWAMKWLDRNNNSFPVRLVAFGIVEGVFFSGSFAAIFWLKERRLMPSLTKANRYIARDESLHCETCVLLYSKVIQKLPEPLVHSMFREALEIETEFVTKSIPIALMGINSDKMIEYVQFIADHWLTRLGYSKIYNSSNPFPWTESSEMDNKNNMFEVHGDSYIQAGVGNEAHENQINFDLDL